MPRIYPASVRRQIVARLRSGESVADVAAETGVCQATRFRWKRQVLVDAGVIEGVPSVEADELAAAHKRIAALEAELALTRDACELFNTEAVVPPKRRRAITEGLIARRTFSSICLPDHGVWRVPCCSTTADGQCPVVKSAASSWQTPLPRSTSAPAARTGAGACGPPCWLTMR